MKTNQIKKWKIIFLTAGFSVFLSGALLTKGDEVKATSVGPAMTYYTLELRNYQPSKVFDGQSIKNPTREQLGLDADEDYDDYQFIWYEGKVNEGKVLYGNPVDVGEYTLIVSLNGKEVGKKTVTISPLDISGAEVTLGEILYYTGEVQSQSISSVKKDGLLVSYTVNGNANTEIGTYSMTITGTDNFCGTLRVSYEIKKAKQAPLIIVPLGEKHLGDETFILTVSGGSGSGEISFFAPEDNGVITINENEVTIVGIGSVEITATKAGDEEYEEITTTYTLKVVSRENVSMESNKQITAVIPEVPEGTEATITLTTDGKGKVVSAVSTVTMLAKDNNKATLTEALVERIQEVAKMNVEVTLQVKADEKQKLFEVVIDSNDLVAGKTLYAYKLDKKTGLLAMVANPKMKVTDEGRLTIFFSKKGTYRLVSAQRAKECNEQILKTIKPYAKQMLMKKKERASFSFSSKMDWNNIKSVKYSSSNKKVLTVDKMGKLVAKAKGKATVKAKVMLKNGSSKTINVKVEVK